MFLNLAAALVLNALTFLLHAGGLIGMTAWTERVFERPFLKDRARAKFLALFLFPTGIFVLLCLEIGLWAFGFLILDAFDDFATAYYFSTSSFATIGFGDVTAAREWGLLASLEGVTGFLAISASGAYLIAAGIRFGPFERERHF